MFIPSGAKNVVPQGGLVALSGLVALKTLVDARIRLAGDTCGCLWSIFQYHLHSALSGHWYAFCSPRTLRLKI